MPKRFRKVLGNEDKFYILLGENGEVWGFDPKNWSRLSESILKFPLSTEEGRVGRLKVFPRAEECSLDGQGRFILPQEFIENLELKNEVLIIGAGDHFEVWDADLWQEQYERISRKRSS